MQEIEAEIESLEIKDMYVVYMTESGEYITEETTDAIITLTSEKLFFC